MRGQSRELTIVNATTGKSPELVRGLELLDDLEHALEDDLVHVLGDAMEARLLGREPGRVVACGIERLALQVEVAGGQDLVGVLVAARDDDAPQLGRPGIWFPRFAERLVGAGLDGPDRHRAHHGCVTFPLGLNPADSIFAPRSW